MIIDETFEYNRAKPVRAGLVTADQGGKRPGGETSGSEQKGVMQ